MPRTKRLDLAGVAQHVIQRGNDRQACFYGEADYTRYLQDLRDAASASGCRVREIGVRVPFLRACSGGKIGVRVPFLTACSVNFLPFSGSGTDRR